MPDLPCATHAGTTPVFFGAAKQDVAQSFSRAAPRYDQHALVQRRIARSLLAHLCARTQVQPEALLDLGAGTGALCAELCAAFKPHHYLGLDIAEGMVRHAARQAETPAAQWLVADAEQLPLADASIDLAFSSLALQWLPTLDAACAELRRVLRPGAWLAFATLGPATLSELRAAWRAVDDRPHVHDFLPLEAVQSAVSCIGKPLLLRESVVDWHPDLRALFGSLREVGAHNMALGRSRALTGITRFRTMQAVYEAYRVGELLPASYDVIHVVVQRR